MDSYLSLLFKQRCTNIAHDLRQDVESIADVKPLKRRVVVSSPRTDIDGGNVG
ncbi:hypothetical protein X759_00670 [Mesorhizobium sp. LSHC420B00]|nr:hypothetical protein X759_00670 [Mesorhizobium sp. LSHC420B00]